MPHEAHVLWIVSLYWLCPVKFGSDIISSEIKKKWASSRSGGNSWQDNCFSVYTKCQKEQNQAKWRARIKLSIAESNIQLLLHHYALIRVANKSVVNVSAPCISDCMSEIFCILLNKQKSILTHSIEL